MWFDGIFSRIDCIFEIRKHQPKLIVTLNKMQKNVSTCRDICNFSLATKKNFCLPTNYFHWFSFSTGHFKKSTSNKQREEGLMTIGNILRCSIFIFFYCEYSEDRMNNTLYILYRDKNTNSIWFSLYLHLCIQIKEGMLWLWIATVMESQAYALI